MSFTVDVRTLDGTCGCCAGATSGIGHLCDGCLDAVRRRDRVGHPHALSAAQWELIERKGRTGGSMDTVYGLVSVDAAGNETLLGYTELGADG